MRTTKLLILLTTASLAFGMAAVKAAKPSKDLPVTTSLADYDAAGQTYSVQSDGGGAYQNGVGGVLSVLLANGYNGIRSRKVVSAPPVRRAAGGAGGRGSSAIEVSLVPETRILLRLPAEAGMFSAHVSNSGAPHVNKRDG